MVKIISLGWGVQSWTLALMSMYGELPKVDFVIHADTGWESSGTYEFEKTYTKFLEDGGIRVVMVNDFETSKKIEQDNEIIMAPVFSIDNNNGNKGHLLRVCTQRWKIVPMRRYISEYLKERGIKKTPGIVEQWLGITTDEFERAKDSDVKYIKHRFPFLELGMSRKDCVDYLQEKGLPSPGKSACTFCPYHSPKFWREIKSQGGENWNEAVRIDKLIRNKRPGFNVFVHPYAMPLEEATTEYDKRKAIDDMQMQMFDVPDDECDSGYCFL